MHKLISDYQSCRSECAWPEHRSCECTPYKIWPWRFIGPIKEWQIVRQIWLALIILTSQKSYIFTWKLPVHKFGQRIFPAAETSKIIFGTRWLKHRTKGRHSFYGSDYFYVHCRTKVRWKSWYFSCKENPGDFSMLYGYLPCKWTPAFTVSRRSSSSHSPSYASVWNSKTHHHRTYPGVIPYCTNSPSSPNQAVQLVTAEARSASVRSGKSKKACVRAIKSV